MRKIISLLLVSITLSLSALSLVSCGEDEPVFPPVQSTAEESRTVMKFTYDGETYNVKYELYKALFVANRQKVDEGDDSVWSSPDAEEKIAEINEIIKDRAAEIYSVIHLAKKQGIDPYSSEFDEKFQEYLKLSVFGRISSGGAAITGHGTYDKYLASLKEMGMNYAVSELLFRYSYAREQLGAKLSGQVQVSEGELKSYYDSDDCARILSVFYQKGTMPLSRINEIRWQLYNGFSSDEAKDIRSACLLIINTMSPGNIEPSAVIDSSGAPVGMPIGLYEFDDYYYSEYTAAAFSLADKEVSGIITVSDVDAGHYIVIGLEKTEDYYNNHKSIIRSSYIQNTVGRRFYTAKTNILLGFGGFTDVIDEIDHSALIK